MIATASSRACEAIIRAAHRVCALKPLEIDSLWTQEELPETYPEGL